MITLQDLTYHYPNTRTPALAHVCWQVQAGEFVLLAGPSASGKSTLLRCLNGLVPHFSGGMVSGKMRIAGIDPLSTGPQLLSRYVGFVSQTPEAQSVLDEVEAEIAFALENSAVPAAEMRVRVEEVLDLLDLAPLRHRSLATLSGGERQRVTIAAALALRPRLLVLDEPTSQLDPQSAEAVLHALVRLNEDLGLTIVIAEHRLERVLRYSDRLTYLREGQIAVDGPPRETAAALPALPPLLAVARALRWRPAPLTIKEGQRFATQMAWADEERTVQSPAAGTPTKKVAHPAEMKESPRSGDSGHGDGRRDALPSEQHSLWAVQTGQGSPLLVARQLGYAYDGRTALKDVSLELHPGEVVAVLGRNGSGKSTLLKCLAGLLTPQAGDVQIHGRSNAGRHVAAISREVAYLPQNPDDLLFAATVREEWQVTLRNHQISLPEATVEGMLEGLGLRAAAEAYPRDLSAGQRQRVALGAVTVTQPKILLLDEPTRGLDLAAKEALAALWRGWVHSGAGLLLVTHDVELVALLAHRVMILSQGEVIAAGPTAGILATSPHFAPQIARLFPGRGWLTTADALGGLGVGGEYSATGEW
jgi:energy-coupling factor transport system ATP-binding protein